MFMENTSAPQTKIQILPVTSSDINIILDYLLL